MIETNVKVHKTYSKKFRLLNVIRFINSIKSARKNNIHLNGGKKLFIWFWFLFTRQVLLFADHSETTHLSHFFLSSFKYVFIYTVPFCCWLCVQFKNSVTHSILISSRWVVRWNSLYIHIIFYVCSSAPLWTLSDFTYYVPFLFVFLPSRFEKRLISGSSQIVFIAIVGH